MGVPAIPPPVPLPWLNPNLTAVEKASWGKLLAKHGRPTWTASRRFGSGSPGLGSFFWGLLFGRMF